MAELTDQQISRMAKARVSFKMHLLVYLAVNVFLMFIWMMTEPDGMPMNEASDLGDYWPMWTHLGWGLGLAIHGFTVYGPGSGMLEREEQKIRDRMGKR